MTFDLLQIIFKSDLNLCLLLWYIKIAQSFQLFHFLDYDFFKLGNKTNVKIL